MTTTTDMNIEIYDNGGATIDRYTVRIRSHVFTMSEDGRGVNQYAGEVSELPGWRNDGTAVPLASLPPAVQWNIAIRSKQATRS